jgi:hypothetical protein
MRRSNLHRAIFVDLDRVSCLHPVERNLVEGGVAAPGDDIALAFGRSDFVSGLGRTNVIWLWRIRS